MLSDRRLLELVGHIYDCVIDTTRWEAVVAEMMVEFGWCNAVLAVNALDGTPAPTYVTLGVPDEYLNLPQLYPMEVFELWGGLERIERIPLEEPIVQSHMTPRSSWATNAYFQAFAAPQGIIDALGVGLARDTRLIATLACGRHERDGEFTEDDIEAVRRIAPHLRRAVTISGLLDEAVGMSATFAAALESSVTGVLLVDSQQRILHTNKTAQEMLAESDPILMQGDIVSLRQEIVPGSLRAAVEAAEAGDGELGRRGLGIPARRADGSAVVVHVLPLRGGTLRPGVMLKASAAIFIASAPDDRRWSADALSLLFGLTPAEARVFELSAEGLTVPQIATALGIATSTAKTHLLRVFDKTGAHRQIDLVRLAVEIIPAL